MDDIYPPLQNHLSWGGQQSLRDIGFAVRIPMSEPRVVYSSAPLPQPSTHSHNPPQESPSERETAINRFIREVIEVVWSILLCNVMPAPCLRHQIFMAAKHPPSAGSFNISLSHNEKPKQNSPKAMNENVEGGVLRWYINAWESLKGNA